MRLWTPGLSACLLLLPRATCSQIPLYGYSEPSASSYTLVDALDQDPDYQLLLRLIQRARLIPTINKLNGSTLWAPTNEAIKKHASFSPLWQAALVEDQDSLDNVNEQLRQELFYHLLNYSLPSLPTTEDPRVEKTLHYPRQPTEHPSPEPPPSPPWLPIPGGTLGGEPQRLRVASRDSKGWVGVDAFGNGGAQIVKGDPVSVDNGILVGIGDVLQVPPDLATVVSQHPSVAYFHRILNAELESLLNNTQEMTLFLPVDAAWNALDPIERLYLESDYATDDLYRILHMHAVHKGVVWSESFNPGVNLTTMSGNELEVVWSPEKVLVSGADLVEPDIYAANGVVHTVSSLLVPPGALELTPEKYLLALNCTSFVSLLHSVNLTSLINDTTAEYTILAPKDDIISVFGDDELPNPGTEELKRLLQYHFIPKKWKQGKLQDGMLLETALKERGLDGGRQVLAIEVNDADKKGKVESSVRFGGAGVIGDPVEVKNALFYFVSRPLTPPVDALQTALPSLDLSTFLAAVFSTNMAELLKTVRRTSFMIPHNDAFKRVGGLVSAYLLTESSKTDLKRVITHHIIAGVEYADSLVNGSTHTYPTLEGSDVRVERIKDGTVYLSPSGGWSNMKSELAPRNMLTQTGVVHEVSDLFIPRSVQLTVGKLVKAAQGTIMATMLSKVGMEWILNGTSPPADSPWADEQFKGVAWTLLCPTDSSFKGINLTRLYADLDQLRDIVGQHIIPTYSTTPAEGSDETVFSALNNNQPLLISDAVTYSTLLTKFSSYGDVVFRDQEGTYIIGIKGARGTPAVEDWANVLSWGRTTTPSTKSGGVIQIDRLLIPYRPTWYRQYLAPILVGAIGVIVIVMFFAGVRYVWRKDLREATYEPVGGFDAREPEEDGDRSN
ncbi:FAS1 domain-containing protein [Punctularia strigosozonata HHB-11173 SS5]|uniref:FAS1 domain-containing protein n=1 Tax=Punctularia strigosozonata (strain HHB-11173) TaxID=741275 RepID=UPI00044166C2|nr:FAS1 domain-containing protein [Punctularia strigosozonata HHB-11173 SS5]EIN14096.1 FAS1 domain-containing protein [Punctularia strigosozonata HHB-11173 SS5]